MKCLTVSGRRCIVVALTMVALLASGAWALDDATLAKEVVAEMSLARTQPQRFAGFIRELRRQMKGNEFAPPGADLPLTIPGGVAAIDEALAFLAARKPIGPLTWSAGLAGAAAELVAEAGVKKDDGRAVKKGAMRKRIERHGKWQGVIGENLSYGLDDPRLVVMVFIINDGPLGKAHRTNLFDDTVHRAGAACGAHPEFKKMCAIDFAGRFSD